MTLNVFLSRDGTLQFLAFIEVLCFLNCNYNLAGLVKSSIGIDRTESGMNLLPISVAVTEDCSLQPFNHLQGCGDFGDGPAARKNWSTSSRKRTGKWWLLSRPGAWGWRDVEEGLQCVALIQLVIHRLLSQISATSSTYFGDRVAFVLCSVWLGASTNHSYCVVTYSSCREGEVLL